MGIDQFIRDGQDAKVVEKIHRKIVGMLTAGESIQYISLQKKPAVTLLPDSITISNKRIFLCEFTRLGLATNFEIFFWSDIKDIAFKEEIFGSKVTVIPFMGENFTIDYIPKVQARKLYQLIKIALEKPTDDKANKPIIEHKRPVGNVGQPEQPINRQTRIPDNISVTIDEKNTVAVSAAEPAPPQSRPITCVEDAELTRKLQKLKTLYDRQLITRAEYENKKSELLSKR